MYHTASAKMPVDDPNDVSQIINMLQNDPAKMRAFKEALNIGSEKDKNKLLLDDHTFRRIEKFAGLTGTWQEWSFGVSMTSSTIDTALSEALEEIKRKAATSLNEDTFGPTKDWEKVTGVVMTRYRQALYGVLISLTSGEANSVVRNVSTRVGGGKCGFGAFYALCVRFNPKTPVRALQFFTQVVNPPVIKNVRELPAAIESWEAKRSLLFNEHEEKFTDKMATAILMTMLPSD